MAGTDTRGRQGKRSAGSFLAGAVSGTVMGAVLQPFDVIRTHLQAQMASPLPATSASTSAPSLGMVATTRRIVASEGVRGLWRGVGPTCIRIGVGAGIYFAALDRVLETLRRIPKPLPHFPLLSLPRTTAPKEPQTSKPADANISHVSAASGGKSVQPGVSGAGDTRGAGARGDGELSPVLTFGAGVVSRSLAVVLLCPVTVVKTRMEVCPRGAPPVEVSRLYLSCA